MYSDPSLQYHYDQCSFNLHDVVSYSTVDLGSRSDWRLREVVLLLLEDRDAQAEPSHKPASLGM